MILPVVDPLHETIPHNSDDTNGPTPLPHHASNKPDLTTMNAQAPMHAAGPALPPATPGPATPSPVALGPAASGPASPAAPGIAAAGPIAPAPLPNLPLISANKVANVVDFNSRMTDIVNELQHEYA
jgi:hypothetical protein